MIVFVILFGFWGIDVARRCWPRKQIDSGTLWDLEQAALGSWSEMPEPFAEAVARRALEASSKTQCLDDGWHGFTTASMNFPQAMVSPFKPGQIIEHDPKALQW